MNAINDYTWEQHGIGVKSTKARQIRDDGGEVPKTINIELDEWRTRFEAEKFIQIGPDEVDLIDATCRDDLDREIVQARLDGVIYDKDIAARLNVHPSTVSRRLKRMSKRLE